MLCYFFLSKNHLYILLIQDQTLGCQMLHILGTSELNTSDLTFNHHISIIINRAARQLGFIRQHGNNFNSNIT